MAFDCHSDHISYKTHTFIFSTIPPLSEQIASSNFLSLADYCTEFNQKWDRVLKGNFLEWEPDWR